MSGTNLRRARFALGTAIALAWSASAFAQPVAAEQKTPGEGDQAAPAAASTDDTSKEIVEVVVTATKRETNLQKTPISISVLDAQGLADRHVESLINLGDGSIPSLRIATFEARQSALTVGIRGIVPFDENQTARDNGVTVYLDGVALGKTQGLNAALLDIERVEVLKGPQGTLFGRNTEGGAVSLVTRGPSGKYEGRLTAGVGNYNSRNVEGHLDLPTFHTFSLKLDGVYQHQDPTTADPLTGSTGFNFYDRVGGRVQLRWHPFKGFTTDFSYDTARDQNTPFYSQLIDYNPNNFRVGTFVNTAAAGATPTFALFTAPIASGGVPCGGTIAAGSTRPVCVAPLAPIVGIHPRRQTVADVGVPQQPSLDLTHGFTINSKYHVAPWLELRSITAWRGVRTDQYDNSGGPERTNFAPNGNFSRYSLSFLRQNQFSQEIQAVGSVPQFDYVAGAYYYTDNATEYAATPQTNQFNADGTAFTIRSPIVTGTVTSANSGFQGGFTASCINAAIPGLCQFVTRDSRARDHNISVFGQGTFTPDFLGDLAHLTLGGRWTSDQRSGDLFIINNILNPNGGRPFRFQNHVSRFDPLINLAVDVTRDTHVYVKYATGFRAGGANDRSLQFNAFGPESVKSYEIGAKTDFFSHRARLNVAAYILDRNNTQFDFDLFDTNATSPTNGAHLEQTTNAGKSKIRGVEADLTVKPTASLTLGGSYAYTYTRAPNQSNPLFGGPPQQLFIVYTPRNAGSATLDYTVPTGLAESNFHLHLDFNYSSSYNTFELEPVRADSSVIVNGRIELANVKVGDNNRIVFALWARNLLDEQHIYRRSNANSVPVLNFNSAGALISTSYGGILGDYANFNPPRTWGVEVSAKF